MSRTLPSSAMLHDPALARRLTLLALALLLLWPLIECTEFHPAQLWEAHSLQATLHFLRKFFPPALNPEFLRLVWNASWQTIAIATTGMTLALLIAIPATFLASASLSVSHLGRRRMSRPARLARHAVRAALVAVRSIPELIWALLLVRVVGLGPTAGVLAIGLSYGGMLGKVYAEILESSSQMASRALLLNGASRIGAFLYGLLPDATGELLSYTIYRWECAVRGSVVMGFVGAGGLGQRMDESLKMLAADEVSTMLMAFVLLVALADVLSAWLRRAMRA